MSRLESDRNSVLVTTYKGPVHIRFSVEINCSTPNDRK